MNVLDMEKLLRGVMLLAALQRKWSMERAGRQPFDEHQYGFALQIRADLADALTSAGLSIAANHTNQLIAALKAAAVEPNGDRFVEGRSLILASDHLEKLVGVVAQEAGSKAFVALTRSFGPPAGTDASATDESVHAAFPEARLDLREAASCLTLERPTAAVFHSMRAMELGVRALGRKLGVAVSREGGEMLPWGVILANLKPAVDALPKGRRQDEWYKLHALLHSVNRAFRTKTAHPEAWYSLSEAEDAFAAVKSFLREMALKMDGVPWREGRAT